MQRRKSEIPKLTSVADCFRIVGAIAVIAGVIFGWLQYIEGRDKEMIEESFAYLKKYNSKDLRSSVEELDEIFDALYEYDEQTALEKKLLDKFDSPKASELLDAVIVFYDEVYRCVVLELCDQDATTDIFQRPGLRLFVFAYPAIERRITGGERSYGRGLECIAKKFPVDMCET